MSDFNFVNKPSFLSRLGNLYDKVSGGTSLDRQFVNNYNKGVKTQKKANKIYFRVIEHKEGLSIPMLVFYKDDKLLETPPMTGNQLTTIKNLIKMGKCKGYLEGNKIETRDRVVALSDKYTAARIFKSGKYYNANSFLNR